MRIVEITSLPRYGTKFPSRQVEPLTHADDVDVAAMRWYTGHGYSPINAQLRGHEPDFERGSDEDMVADYGVAMSNDEGITRIDRVIAQSPKRKRTIRLFRGESNVEVTKRYLAMEVGQSHIDPGYLSTTFDPSRAFYSFAQLKSHSGAGSNAISMYIVPPNVPGAYMAFPEEGDVEQEFIIARGCRYTLREKRTIPVRNKGYPVKEIVLLVWKVTAPINENVDYRFSAGSDTRNHINSHDSDLFKNDRIRYINPSELQKENQIIRTNESVKWSNRTIGDDIIVWVDAQKVRASWEKDRYSYFDGEDHPNAIRGRIPRFGEWIKRGEAVNPSEICLTNDGEVSFINGRHRFFWMLRNGETSVPVAVPPEYANAVKEKFGTRLDEKVSIP